MKALFDTSVLVAALVTSHEFHTRAHSIVGRARDGEFEWSVSQHTIAETYRVLTAMPGAMSPEKASESIEKNIYQSASIVSLNPEDYLQIVKRQGELKNRSGIIFDALIAHAARKIGADRLYTFNPTHFLRAWPEGSAIIVQP